MKSIICKLEQYDIIGFDLDGTLYDEYDFIKQAYKGVSDVIAGSLHIDPNDIWLNLIVEWLKVGSSGPVFQNVFHFFEIQEPYKELIKDCVNAYRETQVELALPDRTRTVLDYLKGNGKKLYLITDGNSDLQRKKIDALGLENWFENMAISGDYGKGSQKPSSYMFESLAKSISGIRSSIYCGDRDVDRQFAASVGIDYLCVKNMCVAQE